MPSPPTPHRHGLSPSGRRRAGSLAGQPTHTGLSPGVQGGPEQMPQKPPNSSPNPQPLVAEPDPTGLPPTLPELPACNESRGAHQGRGSPPVSGLRNGRTTRRTHDPWEGGATLGWGARHFPLGGSGRAFTWWQTHLRELWLRFLEKYPDVSHPLFLLAFLSSAPGFAAGHPLTP